MEFRQSAAWGAVTKRFVFGPEKLEYAQTNGGAGARYAIAYDRIPLGYASFQVVSRKFHLRSYAWAFALSPGLWMALVFSGRPAPEALVQTMLVGLAAVGVAGLLAGGGRVAGTAFKTELGDLEVLKDGQHDAIIALIAERRRTQVRERMGKIDPLNAPPLEAKKFRWLKDNGFITEQEMSAALAELAQRSGPLPPPIQDKKPSPLS